MLRMRIKISRLAALLAMISFLLVNAPYVDACNDRSQKCDEQNLACCKDLCADDSNSAEESDPSPADHHCFACCSINKIIVLNPVSLDEALLPQGTLALVQHFALPHFVTSIERPPEVV